MRRRRTVAVVASEALRARAANESKPVSGGSCLPNGLPARLPGPWSPP